jgi:molecular chaperone GrpE
MSDDNELHVPDDGFAPPEPEVEHADASPENDRASALRALRSLEATQERVAKNAKRETEEAKGKLVMELLPVLDNLDRTIQASREHRGDPAVLEGVRMVRAQLEGVLLRYGVEKIDATGKRFDPSLHEAVGLQPVTDARANGMVAQQYEPGYAFNGKLLRPAKVMVAKYQAPAVQRGFWH